MNWVVPVLQFAYGFFRGVEQGFADRQAGRRLPYEADDSNDWGGHMRALAHATDGVELLTVKPKSASFVISFRSDTYRMVLTNNGNIVPISVVSLISFPPGGLPPSMVSFLVQQNKRLARCKFDCIDDSDVAFFFVNTQINRADLTPPAFHAVIEDLLPLIVGLDETLLKHGLAR